MTSRIDGFIWHQALGDVYRQTSDLGLTRRSLAQQVSLGVETRVFEQLRIRISDQVQEDKK